MPICPTCKKWMGPPREPTEAVAPVVEPVVGEPVKVAEVTFEVTPAAVPKPKRKVTRK